MKWYKRKAVIAAIVATALAVGGASITQAPMLTEIICAAVGCA